MAEGHLLDFRETDPAAVGRLALLALEDRTLRQSAEKNLKGAIARPFLEPLQALLNRRCTSTWTEQHKAALRAFVGEDLGTQHRLWQFGLVSSSLCQACGEPLGNQFHRVTKCCGHEATRKDVGKRHPKIVQQAYMGAPTIFWQRCLAESPGSCKLEEEVPEVEAELEGEADDGLVYTGYAFSDGS